MAKVIIHVLASNSYSGAENVAITLIKGVEKLSDEYDLVYVSPDGPIRDKLSKENVKFEPLKKLCPGEIKRVIKKYKPDIIHAHDFRASVICAVVSKKEKLLYHIHANYLWLKKVNIKSLIFLSSLPKSDKILTVSDSIQKEYIFKKYLQDKIQMIGNPIDIGEIKAKSKNFDIKEKYDIVFLGRLSLAKNPIRFLNIVNEIKKEKADIKVAMIGSGEMEDEVIETIKKSELENTVNLLGFMENPYPYLKKSKVLCMPSLWEGYGLVAVEALSLGVPVVASNVGGLKDLVNEKCGKICKADREYIDEIIKLLSDENYYNEKSKMAEKRAEKIDNLNEYIRDVINIYKNIIG